MSNAHALPKIQKSALTSSTPCIRTISPCTHDSGHTNQQFPSSPSRGDIPLSLRNILGGKLVHLVHDKLNRPISNNLRPRMEIRETSLLQRLL